MSASKAPPTGHKSPRLGGYALVERIGHGGMAVVYKAKREGWSGFEKTVVIKAMRPELAANPEFVEMFIAEAKISAQLCHPGIVQVHDFGVFQGTPYLVMDWLNGINLQQLQASLAAARRRLPVPLALVIATEICQALGYAHAWVAPDGARRQIIHSDVSPANVMVCRDGSVKLLDFGVAKVVDEADYDTSLKPKGKLAYLAPEQIERLPYDRRVDVFAAGVVLHELLTGRRLFSAGSDEQETLRNVLQMEIPPPSSVAPEVSPGLDALVLRALSRDPARRFDSGVEMAAALERIERVGGGKRRIAEFLHEMFPGAWAVRCGTCSKPVVPGLVCKECGTLAPLEASQPGDGTQPVEAPLLHGSDDESDALEGSRDSESDIAGEPVHAPGPALRQRSGLKTATIAVGLIGAVIGVGSTSGRARSWLRGGPRVTPPPPRPTALAVEGTPTRRDFPPPPVAASPTVAEPTATEPIPPAEPPTTTEARSAPPPRRHPPQKKAPPTMKVASTKAQSVSVRAGDHTEKLWIPAFARKKP
jgi:serine/threonine protein kinase